MAAKYDMTKGNIGGHLVSFALPLVLGNLFQLTYNAVDSIIVGRCGGDAAQAAIGVAGPLMNVLIFFIVGCCNGIGVILSECYGAGEQEQYRRQFGTAVSFGLLFFGMLAAVFFALAEPALRMISTPEEIFRETAWYFRIVLCGLIFSYLYNVFAAGARSIGNAKVPLYFLIFSTVMNVGFDLLLVAGLGLGVYGAAFGTVLAQMLSALALVGYVYWSSGKVCKNGSDCGVDSLSCLRLDRQQFRIEFCLLRRILHYSFATGMQKITLNVGKVLIQSFVNPLGIQVVAAFNAVNRVDDFVFQPQQSIAAAMTTFVAQNRGAGKKERVQKSMWICLCMEVTYWVVIGFLIYTRSERLVQLFTREQGSEMVRQGTVYLKYMALFYILPGITNWLQGYVRGWGRMNVCLAATFVQMIGRVGCGAFLIPRYGIEGVAFSCLFGWILMLSYEIPWCLIKRKKYFCEVSRKNT